MHPTLSLCRFEGFKWVHGYSSWMTSGSVYPANGCCERAACGPGCDRNARHSRKGHTARFGPASGRAESGIFAVVMRFVTEDQTL